jgi:hypothetical protein
MAVGDLSPDQARYAAQVAQRTGLDLDVVVAWIGAESGWGVNKASHNYLNIGPGRQYQSVDQAAGAAAELVNSSGYYAGIRSAIPVSPAAQVSAIQASPWDLHHYDGHRLMDVFRSVAGGDGVRVTGANGVVATPVGFPVPLNPLSPILSLPGLGDLSKGLAKATGTDKIVGTAVNAVAGALLQLVFAAAALALIGLGLARLTGNNAGDIFNRVKSAQEQAATVAKIAAVA